MKSYCINLRRHEYRWEKLRQHFLGHSHYPTRFIGVDAVEWGLITKHTYDVDYPGSGYCIPQKHVGMHLSHYWLWRQIIALDYDAVLVLEDDSRYIGSNLNGDLEKYRQWFWKEGPHGCGPEKPTMLFVGSCNCTHKPCQPLDESLGIFDVRWPQCTHAYILNRAAAMLLVDTQEKSWAPIDLALIFNSFPKFQERGGGVYTVLPRLFEQEGTEIHP